jgi:hypothetical protein
LRRHQATPYPPAAAARHYSQFSGQTDFLLLRPPIVTSKRRFVAWVPAVIRSVLKIRYLLLGGAIGGGASLAKVTKSDWRRRPSFL